MILVFIIKSTKIYEILYPTVNTVKSVRVFLR